MKLAHVISLVILLGAFALPVKADNDPKPNVDTVTVLGAVKNPGTYDYKENMTVMEVLTVAGGVLSDTADLSAATLTHDGKESPLDLTALLKKGDMANNVKLSPGDRLLIPANSNRVHVYGKVRQTGFYFFHANDRVLDAIAAAGGPLPSADLNKVNLIHIGHDPKHRVQEFANLLPYLTKGDETGNKRLQPGDSVCVPGKLTPKDYLPPSLRDQLPDYSPSIRRPGF